MAVIIFALFTIALVAVAVINAKEETPTAPSILTAEQISDLNRLEILRRYQEQADSDYRQGIITENEYRAEKTWLSGELDKFEDKYTPKEENPAECPEMAEMRKGAEEFFNYTDKMFGGKR